MQRHSLLLGILLAGGALAAPSWPDLSQSSAAPGGGENDAALIVAIEHYASLPAIPGAVQNANDWYAYLTRGLKVPPSRVHLLRNNEAAKEKILSKLQTAMSDARPGGRLWLVFIGHGAPAKDGLGGILVGYDAQQDAELLFARSVPQTELLEKTATLKGVRTVALIDACFSGRDSSGSTLVKGLQPVIPVRQTAEAAQLTMLTAGAPDQFAGPLPDARRPAFSYLALGALRGWGDENKDGEVTADELLRYTQESLQTLVVDRVQTPQLTGTGGALVLARGVERGPDLTPFVLERKTMQSASELDFGDTVAITVPKTVISPSSGLKDINIQAEERLERALDVEEAQGSTPDQKADAWCALAAVSQSNPYAGKAVDACRAWRSYANAVKRREAALVEDYQKLAKYLQLRRRTTEQKLAANNAFLNSYGSAGATHPLIDAATRSKALLAQGQEATLADVTPELASRCEARKDEACVILGNLHLRGMWPFEADAGKARELYQRACDGVAPSGCSALGRMYEAGQGVELSLDKAGAHYDKACTQNDASGCALLAALHRGGKLPSREPLRAAALFERGCDLGEPNACIELAFLFKDGQLVEKNIRRALELLHKACDSGDARGCDKAAALHLEVKDEAGFVALADKGCQTGRVVSCLELGNFLKKRDVARAKQTYEKGCTLGSKDSCDALAAFDRELAARALAIQRKREADERTRAMLEQQARADRESRLEAERRGRKSRRELGYVAAGIGGASALMAVGFMVKGELNNAAIRNGDFATAREMSDAAGLAPVYNVFAGAGVVGALLGGGVGIPIILANQPTEAAVAITGDGAMASFAVHFE